MKAWFIISGVITLTICFFMLGDLIRSSGYSHYTKDYASWFFPSTSLLSIVVIVGIAKVFTYFAGIGLESYTSVTERQLLNFPQLWFWFFALHGIVLMWFYPIMVAWYETGPTSEDVFVALFQLVLMIPVGLLIVLPLALLNVAYTIFGTPLMLFGLIAQTPFFFIGIYSYFAGGSREAIIADKILKNKRPDSALELELAQAMVSGIRTDAELSKIIGDMSSAKKFFHTLTYKKKAEKYREIIRTMNATMNAQADAKNARADMGEAAHEFERTRRRRE